MNKIKKIDLVLNIAATIGIWGFIIFKNPWILVVTFWVSTVGKDILLSMSLGQDYKNRYNRYIFVAMILFALLYFFVEVMG